MANPTATEILNVRREAIGDSTDTATLADADITYYWTSVGGAGVVLLTAALCCDMLAARAASAFRFSADGQSIDKTMQMNQYRANAIELRRRYLGAGESGSMTLARVGDADETEYTA